MSMSIWFLVGAILVFFMQCGFAMVETGFTRAKNAGNIIMKNLMDFCIGTVMFFLLGYGLMMGRHGAYGLIGRPDWSMLSDFAGFDWSALCFSSCSAPRRRPSSPARWRSGRVFRPTACIRR